MTEQKESMPNESVKLNLATDQQKLMAVGPLSSAGSSGFAISRLGSLAFAWSVARRWSMRRAGEAPSMTLIHQDMSLFVSLHAHKKTLTPSTPIPINRSNIDVNVDIDITTSDEPSNKLDQLPNDPPFTTPPPPQMTLVKTTVHEGDQGSASHPIPKPRQTTKPLLADTPQASTQNSPPPVQSEAPHQLHTSTSEFRATTQILKHHTVTQEVIQTLRKQMAGTAQANTTPANKIPAIESQPQGQPTQFDVDHLTNRVVNTIERRLTAMRERKGNF